MTKIRNKRSKNVIRQIKEIIISAIVSGCITLIIYPLLSILLSCVFSENINYFLFNKEGWTIACIIIFYFVMKHEKIATDKILYTVFSLELICAILLYSLYPEFWKHTNCPNGYFYQLNTWALAFSFYDVFFVLPVLLSINSEPL